MTFFGVRPIRYILNLSVNTLKDISVSIFIMENNKIIIKDYFESKVTIILDENNTAWFKGCDVATILGYGNSREAMKKPIDMEDKKKMKEIMPSCGVTSLISQPHTTYINEKGLKSLVCKSRMSKSIDLAKLLQIDINNHKYERKESETQELL